MSPTSAGTVETSATHADTSMAPGHHTHTAGRSALGTVASSGRPSTSNPTSAAIQSEAQSCASVGPSPTATPIRAAAFATEGHISGRLRDQLPHQTQAGLQHNVQGPEHWSLQVPAPSLTPLSAARSISTSTTLLPILCQGQDNSAARAFDEQHGAEPTSAEAYMDSEASNAQHSSAAAFLDDILAQSNSGRLFKGRTHMHRLAGANVSGAQPADDLLDRHVSVAKLPGHHTDAVVYTIRTSAHLAPFLGWRLPGCRHARTLAIDWAPSHLNTRPKPHSQTWLCPCLLLPQQLAESIFCITIVAVAVAGCPSVCQHLLIRLTYRGCYCINSELVWLPACEQLFIFLTQLSHLQMHREPVLQKALGHSPNDEQDQQPSGNGEGQPEAVGDGVDQPEASGDGEDPQQASGDSEGLQRSSGDDEDEQHSCRGGEDQQQASMASAESTDVQDSAPLSGYGSCVQTMQLLRPGSFLSRGSSLRSGDFAALLLPGHLPSRTSLGGTTSCYKPYLLFVCLRPMQT